MPACDISIVIPFLNEREHINLLLGRLNDYIAGLKGINVEVVFVDDGSTDGSTEVILKSLPLPYRAKLIKLARNFGSHAAIRAGIANSAGAYVTFLCADLQDPPELAGKLYEKCREGYDIVFAHRNNAGGSAVGRFFSRLYAMLMILFVARNFPRNGLDIVMFGRKAADELNQITDTNTSVFLQLMRLGLKQSSISYSRDPRFSGKSKWTLAKKIKLVMDSFIGFSRAPLYFILTVGIILSMAGFVRLNILLTCLGITNICLWITGEYLSRVLDILRKKKAFVIGETINCNDGQK